MEKQIELLQSYIALKESYEGLGLSNLWAAHLLAWESRFSSSNGVRQLVANALRPNDGKKVVENKKTVFVNTTTITGKTQKCDGCEEARKSTILKTSYRDKITGAKPLVETISEEPALSSIDEILEAYPSVESLMRAATQLGLKPHPATKENKLAKLIFDHLNLPK